MEQIKYKRINNVIIVVAGDILQRELESDEMYDEIVGLITKINTGKYSGKKQNSLMDKLIEIMLDIRNERLKAEEDAVELATEDLTTDQRKELMKKVSTVHDQFEYDLDGYAYLKGYSVPIPKDVAEALIDAKYNPESNYTVTSIINFWKWALLNPNKRARNDLFGWFKTGKFSITESGNIVAYRCVAEKSKGKSKEYSSDILAFAQRSFIKIKKWKRDPAKYYIEETADRFELTVEQTSTNLQEVYTSSLEDEVGDIYTDNHTKKMTIKIGQEVSMDRSDCDENEENSCSRGLHFMSLAYNLRLGSVKLVVLVNPMNIVAFPSYDNTKGRSCSYMPISLAELDDAGNILEFDAGTYDLDYDDYNVKQLESLLGKNSLQELKDSGAISEDVTEKDLQTLRESLAEQVKAKVVYAE